MPCMPPSKLKPRSGVCILMSAAVSPFMSVFAVPCMLAVRSFSSSRKSSTFIVCAPTVMAVKAPIIIITIRFTIISIYNLTIFNLTIDFPIPQFV